MNVVPFVLQCLDRIQKLTGITTYLELAEVCGVSEKTLYRIRTGESTQIPVSIISTIGVILGYDDVIFILEGLHQVDTIAYKTSDPYEYPSKVHIDSWNKEMDEWI